MLECLKNPMYLPPPSSSSSRRKKMHRTARIKKAVRFVFHVSASEAAFIAHVTRVAYEKAPLKEELRRSATSRGSIIRSRRGNRIGPWVLLLDLVAAMGSVSVSERCRDSAMPPCA